ncbi:saccharopine dehydrogenase [Kitasatospora purpeofusca]|uniref:Saccharopine dehydrogenase [NAD(+), L-lysine-forming] n=1 Tax=Kitasatospora purpeofusca TaxID=67352 RepID=A0ABZ1UDD2_9ACTN|nr:saccharopine dehydrogenase [Kitasatospora purpeofusca]
MRHETRRNERRAALAPADARGLIERGVRLTVEESSQRVFPVHEYAAAGCVIAPQGSWASLCPSEEYVLGLKELPGEPARLGHRHIYFGHAYKGQAGAPSLLRRFEAGGGVLLDLEYLVDAEGHRLAAFGHWAGYAGAALAVLHRRGLLTAPLASLSRRELDGRLRPSPASESLTAVVIGAHGRSGRGACDALGTAGVEVSRWNSADTRALDRDALLAHDILVNAIGTDRPVAPFVTKDDLDDPRRRLSVIGDVTCDVGSNLNALPVYDRCTDWDRPVERLGPRHRPLDVIAIDNLPSLLPTEASRAFSADLWPLLLALREGSPVWENCLRTFRRAVGSMDGE